MKIAPCIVIVTMTLASQLTTIAQAVRMIGSFLTDKNFRDLSGREKDILITITLFTELTTLSSAIT